MSNKAKLLSQGLFLFTIHREVIRKPEFFFPTGEARSGLFPTHIRIQTTNNRGEGFETEFAVGFGRMCRKERALRIAAVMWIHRDRKRTQT